MIVQVKLFNQDDVCIDAYYIQSGRIGFQNGCIDITNLGILIKHIQVEHNGIIIKKNSSSSGDVCFYYDEKGLVS